MENKFRVVKVTKMNGQVMYGIQKLHHHWLTRKPVWKYYGSYACDSMYTENVNDAELYWEPKNASSKMNDLINMIYDNIVNVDVVETVIIETDGNRSLKTIIMGDDGTVNE